MDYSFISLNTRDFEHLVQALAQKLLGRNSIVFGDGPDGARELTYRGKANFPNENETWDGYWIVQAKFKARKFDTEDDFDWIKSNFISEMKKFQDIKRNIEKPNNYLFFTNTRLTAVQNSGGRDKIEKLKNNYTSLIPNIYIASYDELCKLLDNNRDIATTFSSFILAGDILAKLYKLLDYEEKKKQNIQNLILTFLEKSFNAELFSKLIQAGDLTNQINIEKVFIDIDVTSTKKPNNRIKFLNQLIKLGNSKWTSDNPCKLVLFGSAGSGKSTLSQFASQIYSAFFVFDNRKNVSNEKIKNFIKDFSICDKPDCLRFPFKIVLKDFATWIKEQDEIRQSKTILNYIKYRFELIGDGIIDLDIIRELLGKISFLFIFDGLDEVPVTSNRNEVLKEINDFIEIELKNQNSDALILCTTRQQGYTKEFEENSFLHYFVCDLSDDDCNNYLEKLLTNIEISYDDRQSYLKTLKEALKDEVTGRLMRTPLQATIMTILVKSGGKPSRNKYNLFKEYYETIYKRELQKELLPILKDYKRNIDDIHALLGFELQVKSEGRENPSALFESIEFQNLIRLYLKKKEEWEDNKIESFIHNITNAVTERLVFISEIQENKIGFIIRSLQEYFAANYIINYCDITVISNIKDIAKNSYWRNTFIFVVSGLHNTKNHLIDQVYLHCERLNGIEEVQNITSLYNIIFCGSWLALDILSEGIFSDSPKNINRFIGLLDKLFFTTKAGDLSKILYLQNEIIIDVIIQKYIKDILFSEKPFIKKYSSYKLSFYLLKESIFSPYIYEILNKSWREEYEFDLLFLMNKSKISGTNFFIEKLYYVILKDNFLKYSDIFKQDFSDNFNMTRILVKKYKKDKILICRIIEISFLILLDEYSGQRKNDIYAIYNEIMDYECFTTSKKVFSSILGFNNKIEEIKIVDGYSVSLGSINIINIHFDAFDELFRSYSLKYLSAFNRFFKCPSSTTLYHFFVELKAIGDNDIFKILLIHTPIWLFKEIYNKFNNFSQIDKLIQSLKNGDFADISEWLVFEDKMLTKQEIGYLLKYKSGCSIEIGVDIINNFCNEFESNLLHHDINIQFELMSIICWGTNVENMTLSPNIMKILSNIFTSINITSLNEYQIWILRTIFIIYLNNLDISHFEKINNDFFKLYDFFTYFEFRNPKKILINVFKKCIDYYNITLTLNKQNYIEQLLANLLFILDDYAFEQIKHVNFKTKEISIEESIYRILLRLISEQFNLKDIDIIKKKFCEYSEAFNLYKVISKLFLNLKINEDWCSDFFVKSYIFLIAQNVIDINTIENIEQYLKFINESKLSNMKKLQLIN